MIFLLSYRCNQYTVTSINEGLIYGEGWAKLYPQICKIPVKGWQRGGKKAGGTFLNSPVRFLSYNKAFFT